MIRNAPRTGTYINDLAVGRAGRAGRAGSHEGHFYASFEVPTHCHHQAMYLKSTGVDDLYSPMDVRAMRI